MSLGQNNPLVRRIRRHRQMSVLFRTPVKQPSGSDRYQFVQPMVQGTQQLPINVRPVEPALGPLSAEDAISRAERPSLWPITVERPPLQRPPEPEAETVQMSPGPAPTPVAIQPASVEPSVEPSAPAAPREVGVHDQDWDGEWGRLKNILGAHDAQEPSEAPEEKPEDKKPTETKPKPRRLSDVQRQIARGGRYPKPGERRRAKIEYVSPGDPVTIPKESAEAPPEVSSEVAEAGAVAGADASAAVEAAEQPSVTEPSSNEGVAPTLIQRVEEPPESLVELDEAVPEAQEIESEPETLVEAPIRDTASVQGEVSEAADEEVKESIAVEDTEAVSEPIPTAEPGHEELTGAVPEVAPKEEDAGPEAPVPSAGSQAAAIQRAEAPAAKVEIPELKKADDSAKDLSEPVDEKAESILDDGIIDELPDVTAPDVLEAEPEQILMSSAGIDPRVPAEPESISSAEDPAEQVEIPTVVQREAAEQPAETPSMRAEDRLQAAIHRAESPTEAPEQVTETATEESPITQQIDEPVTEEKAGFAQRLLDRTRRLFSREEPEPAPTQQEITRSAQSEYRPPEKPVVKATLAAPVGAQTFPDQEAIRADKPEPPKLEPEIFERDQVESQAVESLPAQAEFQPAEKPLMEPTTKQTQAVQRAEAPPAPKPAVEGAVLSTTETGATVPETTGLVDETIQAPSIEVPLEIEPEIDEHQPEVIEEPGVDAGAAEIIKQAEQQVPLEQAWPVQRITPREPVGEKAADKLKKETVGKSDVAQRKSVSGDTGADIVDEALREVAPEEDTDSSVELITPRRPRPVPKPAPAADVLTKREETAPAVPEVADAPEASVQRAPDVGMPVVPSPSDSDAAPAAAETQAADESQDMIPTGVGDLPADFWRLIGQRPPQPPPGPSPDTGMVDARVQREPLDVANAIAAAERPALDVVTSQEVGQDSVQREVGRLSSERLSFFEPSQPEAAEASAEAPVEAPGEEEEIDVDELARKVYSRLKTKLRIERERNHGRF